MNTETLSAIILQSIKDEQAACSKASTECVPEYREAFCAISISLGMLADRIEGLIKTSGI